MVDSVHKSCRRCCHRSWSPERQQVEDDAQLARASPAWWLCLQMILDGKLAGTLDAGSGCLEVFDEPPADAVFPSALESLTHLGAAIDTLAVRSQKVMA